MLEVLELEIPQTVEGILELQRLAYLDALTGLLNRRAFDLLLPKACRNPAGAVLLFVDFDDLKKANQELGHQGADLLLVGVGEVLAKHLKRYGDAAFRFGGDEMAVLLPECTAEYAESLAESIRAAVEAIGCSISVGIAAVDEEDRSADWRLLVTKANDAMYEAKRLGKNQVVVWDTQLAG